MVQDASTVLMVNTSIMATRGIVNFVDPPLMEAVASIVRRANTDTAMAQSVFGAHHPRLGVVASIARLVSTNAKDALS